MRFSVREFRSHRNRLAVSVVLVTLLGASLNARPKPGDELVVASSSQLNFGAVVVGTSRELTTTIFNHRSSRIVIRRATVRGNGFEVVSPALPVTIRSHRRMQFTVRFTPRGAGSPSGSVTFANGATQPIVTVALSGRGVPAGKLSVSTASIDFGGVRVGQNQVRSWALSNTGGTAVTVSQLSVSNAAFQLNGAVVPFTLAPGGSTNFSVGFTPQTLGATSGAISVAARASLSTSTTTALSGASASAGTIAVRLSGTGTGVGQLLVTPAGLNFGTSQVGDSVTKTLALTNSGDAPVTVTQAGVNGAGFAMGAMSLPLTVAAGQSRTVNVTFSPASAGAAAGKLSIASDAANPSLSISLSGSATEPASPGVITPTPASLSFGSVQVGNKKIQPETLTNTGGSEVVISQASVTGSGFSLSGLEPPLKIAAGESFTFDVVFAPQSGGNATGSISLTSDAASAIPKIALAASGTAVGQLSVSPASLNFGNVTVGTSKTLSATLQATGAPVTVTGADVNSPEFSVGGASFPLSIAAGQSAQLTVQFTPQSSGSASANISLSTNASNPLVTASLTGSGLPVPQHRVDLSWSPSASSVVGYNVYRGIAQGGSYTKLNASPDAGTSYTDSSVQAGQTYYYVTTAVDTAGGESGFSNEVPAVIPAP